MPEWSNGAVSKTAVRSRVPRVRIPLSPPDLYLQIYTRLLSKLAYVRQMQGAYGAQKRTVLFVHEHSSTRATLQLITLVEFQKKSSALSYNLMTVVINYVFCSLHSQLLRPPLRPLRHLSSTCGLNEPWETVIAMFLHSKGTAI